MPTRDELLDLFRESGALLEGHFRLTSGLHSTGYLQCALVLQHPAHAEALGRAIAERTRDLTPTVVLSPALGGVVIGHEVGRALGVRALFAERQDGVLTLRRGFTLAEPIACWSIEDVLTTGGSTRETMQVARAAGGQVVGAASIVDRSGGTRRFDVPFHALLDDRRCRPTSPTPARCARRDCRWSSRVASHRRVKPRSRSAVPSRGDADADFKLTLAYDGTGFVGWQRQAAGTRSRVCSKTRWRSSTDAPSA